MREQNKSSNSYGYSRSKGGCGIWTRQLQEKDLYLNSESVLDFGKEEKKVPGPEQKQDMEQEMSLVFRVLDFVKHRFGE